ncbi:class I SAM-dependent methyltransferase [Hymenobacter sp. PAMC 26628]|uniref:class I SAM-dependent methyltransferase n=1 Tax=Hymenobacter sp. PAMC 26628 TaxID=1484118 RepID=UPI00077030F0|nr:class I SAM-dependent methyltransferase [Hymenobacter sp. PAMC 26628]AMJ64817.1 methyltransferase [Hymenobacter sp. PAMC 26628]
MNKSAGYESVATVFIKGRGCAVNGAGTSSVRDWVRTLSSGSTVLDIGCGTGVPISKTLIEEGMTVYGIDASPTLVNAFQKNFPSSPIACESVEDSSFFNLGFDAIVAWGLLFLLSKESQVLVIQKAATALRTGGKLLFTAPSQNAEWKDVMTGQQSLSLGTAKYKEVLATAGLSLLEEFEDEGGNHYFNTVKN